MKNIFSFFPIIFCISLIFVVFSYFPVLIVKSPYKIYPSIIKQGDSFTLESDYCKLLPLPARFQLVYVGDLKHPTPESYSSNSFVGCRKDSFHFDSPESLPPGKYHIELITSYPPFITNNTYKSEEFEIVENESLEIKVDNMLNIINKWFVYETQ